MALNKHKVKFFPSTFEDKTANAVYRMRNTNTVMYQYLKCFKRRYKILNFDRTLPGL